MKRVPAIVAALASVFALSATAQTAAPAAGPKVAVIAFQAAVTSTNEFQRAYGDVQKKFEPQRTQLQSLSTEIDTLTKQLQTTGDKLTDADREAKARTLDDKKKQAQRLADDAQSDFQQQLQDNFGKVAAKVAELLSSYSKEQGFTLVIDASEQQQQAPLVLYASPNTDITKAIVDAYNAKSGIPAPPAAVPSAPAPAASKPPAP
ncbi:MAG TPA: OmpH family outer membrane protein [Terracidiphilus sp.]|nr:OmpH family outer membrane protein [Terracidiphilus sp.]